MPQPNSQVNFTCGEEGGGIIVEGSAPTLSCITGLNSLHVIITGGVEPFIVAASIGLLTESTNRDWVIDIGPVETAPYAEKVGRIAYFKPHAFTYGYQLINNQQSCVTLNPGLPKHVEMGFDTRLRSYDCLQRYIPGVSDYSPSIPDNLAPDNVSFYLAHPIGDDEDDRTCDIAVDWPVVAISSPSHPHSDPGHFSVNTSGCTDGDPGNASVHVTATLAGKNGIHGTIHAAAPAFDETLNSPPIQIVAFASDEPIRDTDFDTYMDVRTQAQVDTECCLVPAGDDVTITVVDAADNIVILVIPVV
jgi:hypothetical protein